MFTQERTKVTQLSQKELIQLLSQEFKVPVSEVRFVVKTAEEEYMTYPRQYLHSVVITQTELLKSAPRTEQIIKTTILAEELKTWIISQLNCQKDSQVSFNLRSIPDDSPGFSLDEFSHAFITEKN